MTKLETLSFKEKIELRKRIIKEEGVKYLLKTWKDYILGIRCTKCLWPIHMCSCQE